jgi:CRISPR-associated exonuclease Cas4
MNVSGTHINYFFHCKRQVWLYSHNIKAEHESDTVRMGKHIHETSYERKKKEIELGSIKIDFFDVKDGVLHEVKKSNSFEEAHKWQTLYYMSQLKKKGVVCTKGEIDYPKQKERVDVYLTPDLELELEKIVKEITEIIDYKYPPKINVKFSLCKACSYFELCFS